MFSAASARPFQVAAACALPHPQARPHGHVPTVRHHSKHACAVASGCRIHRRVLIRLALATSLSRLCSGRDPAVLDGIQPTDHYAASQWPALLRPLSQLAELPQMVLERYAGVQTVAFCGVFPELGRAWASIDNSLFLWRYDRWWADAASSPSLRQFKPAMLRPDGCVQPVMRDRSDFHADRRIPIASQSVNATSWRLETYFVCTPL